MSNRWDILMIWKIPELLHFSVFIIISIGTRNFHLLCAFVCVLPVCVDYGCSCLIHYFTCFSSLFSFYRFSAFGIHFIWSGNTLVRPFANIILIFRFPFYGSHSICERRIRSPSHFFTTQNNNSNHHRHSYNRYSRMPMTIPTFCLAILLSTSTESKWLKLMAYDKRYR